MARWQKFNLIRYSIIGGVMGILALILSAIFRFFPIPTYYYQGKFIDFTASTAPIRVDIRNQILATGQFKEVGARVMNFIEGNLAFSAAEFLGTLVITIIIVLVGRWIVGYFKPSKFVQNLRVFLSVVTGMIGFAIVVPPFLGIPFIAAFSSAIIYGLVLGLLMQVLVNVKWLQFIRE